MPQMAPCHFRHHVTHSGRGEPRWRVRRWFLYCVNVAKADIPREIQFTLIVSGPDLQENTLIDAVFELTCSDQASLEALAGL